MIKDHIPALPRWCLSLGRKFAKVIPVRTTWIVFLTLVSQVSMLAASLLPLKIIIMLGSPSMPSYFPGMLRELDQSIVLGGLIGATVVSFLAHVIAEKMITQVNQKASRILLEKSHKMVLFSDQESIASKAYERFSRGLAGMVFVGMSTLALLLIYPGMAIAIIIYVAIIALIFSLLYHRANSTDKEFNNKLKTALKPLNLTGFFVAFGVLLIDFISSGATRDIFTILALLLTRQLLSQLQRSINDFLGLWNQKLKIDALFFHNRVLMPALPAAKQGFWQLLHPDERHPWLSRAVSEATNKPANIETSQWLNLTGSGVASFKVKSDQGDFLVKLYEKNRAIHAIHESMLLTDKIKGLPALAWAGSTMVENYHSLVLHLPKGAYPHGKEGKASMEQAKIQLASIKIPKALRLQFSRAKPLLPQRLASGVLERLWVVAETPEVKANVANLLKNLNDIIKQIKALPLMIINPNARANQLWVGEDKTYYLHWQNWSLEPMGAGWLKKAKDINEIEATLAAIKNQRTDLKNIHADNIKLCALMFIVEQACRREKLSDVVNVLPIAMKQYQQIQAKIAAKRKKEQTAEIP